MENDVFAVIREFQTKMDKYARMDSTDLGLEIINIAIAICAKSTKFDKPSDILQSLTVVEDPPPDVVEMVRDRYRQLGVI